MNTIDQTKQELDQTLENALVKQGLSREEARKHLTNLQENVAKTMEEKGPEISKRLDLLNDIPTEQVMAELLEFVKDTTSEKYSEEEKVRMTNEVFNIIGFSIDKNQNNEYQLNLSEPKV